MIEFYELEQCLLSLDHSDIEISDPQQQRNIQIPDAGDLVTGCATLDLIRRVLLIRRQLLHFVTAHSRGISGIVSGITQHRQY